MHPTWNTVEYAIFTVKHRKVANLGCTGLLSQITRYRMDQVGRKNGEYGQITVTSGHVQPNRGLFGRVHGGFCPE